MDASLVSGGVSLLLFIFGGAGALASGFGLGLAVVLRLSLDACVSVLMWGLEDADMSCILGSDHIPNDLQHISWALKLVAGSANCCGKCASITFSTWDQLKFFSLMR